MIRRLLVDTIIYGLGTMLSPLVGFLLLPIYTRFLTPADYGVLAILSVTTGVLTIVLSLGIPSGMLRFYFDPDEKVRNQVIYSSIGAVFATTTVGSLLIAALASPLSRILVPGPQGPYLVVLMAAGFATGAWTAGFQNLMRAQEKPALYTVSNLGGFALRLGLNILFVVGFLRGVAGILEAGIISNVAILALLVPVGLWARKPSFSWEKLKQILKFGIALEPGNLAAWALNMADRYFLQALSNMTQVGLYSVGYKIGQLSEIGMVKPFRLAWPPLIYAEAAHPDRAKRTIARVATGYLFVGLWASLGLFLLAPAILKAMATPQYWGALDVVGLVALSYVILGTTWVTGAGLHILKKPVSISIAFLVGAIINLGLNFLLIPRFGMMGAAWATVLSFIFIAIFTFFVSQRQFSVPYEWRKLVAIVLWATLIAIASLVSGRVWWRILLSAAFPLPALWFYRKALFGTARGFLVRRPLVSGEDFGIPEGLLVERVSDPSLADGFRKGMEEVYRQRLERGVLCYVGFWKGEPAHITWVATRGEREPRTGYRARPGVAYVFDSLTLPEFRGHGIYAGVLEQVSRDARDNGMTLAEAIVLEGNEPSMRAFGNAGFRPLARVVGVKVFGMTFCLRRRLERGEG
jgi:O-antigen/teichoic acid export membrane protein/GNAT superfamily N-acetyltransferase